MATFKAIIKKGAENKQGLVNIKIRITHNRKARFIATTFYINPDNFDITTGKIKKSEPNYEDLNDELIRTILSYRDKLAELGSVISSFAIDDLINYLNNESKEYVNFFEMMQKYIKQLHQAGQKRTSKIYQSSYNILAEFVGVKYIYFSNINFDFLNRFETYLKVKGLKTNAIAIHLRNMRAIFNRAIDEEIIGLETYPFRRFKIKHEKTVKRNLTVEQLKHFRNVKLEGKNAWARDFFFLSFYLIGMNIIDLYYLKELKAGRILYRRAKTGRIYNIKVLPQAKKLIKKYKGKNFLLNFADMYANPDNLKKAVSKYLRSAVKAAEINEPVTSYYARHSWATIASSLGISKDIIAHALGHGNDTVTDVYIDFDLNKVDLANQNVISAIN